VPIDTFFRDIQVGFESSDGLESVPILKLEIRNFFVADVIDLVHEKTQCRRILEVVPIDFRRTVLALATFKCFLILKVTA
jgi:hypothetical protein